MTCKNNCMITKHLNRGGHNPALSLKVLFTVLFSLFIISCSNLVDNNKNNLPSIEKAYISVNVENQTKSASRTLLPAINVRDLVLKGRLSGQTEEILASAATLEEMTAKKIEIQTGEWTFTLIANVSGVSFSGSTACTIVSGGENPVAFQLEPDAAGDIGFLDFSLSFNGTEGVSYDIVSTYDGSYVDSKSITGSGTYTFSENSLIPGTHKLQVNFYLAGDTSKAINTYQTIVRIERGITTKAEIKGISLNQIYSITYNNIEEQDYTSDTLVLKFFRKSEAISLPGYYTSVPGLSFSGWFDNPDFTGEEIIEIDPAQADSLKDQQLYAKWIYDSSGSISHTADYNFTFSASSKFIKPNKSKDITIKPAVKRGSANILYDGQNKKIDGNDVIWNFALYNDGSVLNDVTLTSSATDDGIKVNIPALDYADTYSLYVCAELKGVKHATEFLLTPPQAVDASSVISQINNAAVDSVVKVEGILDEEKFVQIAEAAGTNSITLDLSDTEGLTKVPDNAFNQGRYIQGIILPEGVTTIEDNAFWCLYGLKKLHIPASVTSIDMGAFFLCATNNGLDVTLGEGSTTFKYENGAIYTMDGKKLVRFCNGRSTSSFTVPASVEVIGEYAFTGAKMSAVYFEEGSALKSIETMAFDYCDKMYSISIPDSVTSMGDSALRYCSNLTSVKLPSGWTVIDKSLFGFCNRLTTLKIPEGVTKICNNTFSHNYPPLQSLYLPLSLTEIESSAFYSSTKLSFVSYAGSEEQKNLITNINSISLLKNAIWSYNVEY